MQPHDQSPNEPTQGSTPKVPPVPSPSTASDPAYLAALSRKLLGVAKLSRLSSREGQGILDEIEKLPWEEERALVVNATSAFASSSRGVLALHTQKMSQALLSRLVALGIDLRGTFPIYVEARGRRPLLVDGVNVCHLAAVRANIELLRILPQDNKLFDARTASGETPLLLALKYGEDTQKQRDVIKMLITLGADITVRDDSGRGPFHYALHYPGSSRLDLLLECWSRQAIIPINRYEVQTGLALALLGPKSATARAVAKLSTLVELALPGEGGVAVAGLLEHLEELIPRKDDEGAQRSKAKRGRSSDHSVSLREALDRLKNSRALLGEEVIQLLTESLLPSSDLPLLATAYEAGASAQLLAAIVALGANSSVQFDSSVGGVFEVHGGTLLHHAVKDNNLSVAETLLASNPSLAKVTDDGNNTPLVIHLRVCCLFNAMDKPNFGLMESFLSEGCPVDEVNGEGKRAMDYAFELGCLRTIELLARYRADPLARDAQRTFKVRSPDGYPQTVDFLGLVRCALEWQSKIESFHAEQQAQQLIEDSTGILRQSRSVHPAYLSLVAGAEVLVKEPAARSKPEMGLALLSLSRDLLFYLSPHASEGIWGAIEYMSDVDPRIRTSRKHFNEAEMMLLLNHPRGVDPDKLNSLTRALTATTRLVDAGIPVVSRAVVWNWARIGIYTHGFHLLFKFDAQSFTRYERQAGWQLAGKALIEGRLSFSRLWGQDYAVRSFGPSYLLLASELSSIRARLERRAVYARGEELPDKDRYQAFSLDSLTMMEFRQGYLLVSNPGHGTLVIRNSSRDFGRDTLPNVAYWTPRAYRKGHLYTTLVGLTAAQIQSDMKSVLDPDVVRSHESTESIYFLLRQLDVIRDYNRRQKFDTFGVDAFVYNPRTQTSELADYGGYRAPGFSKIVDFLETRFRGVKLEMELTGQTSQTVPALAFALPWYPPWVTHRFAGEGGMMRSSLRVNKEVLEVLRAYADETFTVRTRQLDDQYGVGRFFQEAGFDTEGELVLVNPREEIKPGPGQA